MIKAYFDNGATTRTATEVLDAMAQYHTEKYGNASSLHSLGQDARDALENARSIIAKSINALPEEIIFTSGGTESDNLAIKGITYKGIAYEKGKGQIITSKIEHPAVLNTCKMLESKGFKVTCLEVDEKGIININQLKKEISPETILVSIMHANNEIGTIQPIAEIGEICRKHAVFFHTDAVQSYTKTVFDVKKMNICMASFSAHKIHGPKGVGALYIKKELKKSLQRQIDGGSHEFSLRAGTENIPGIVGFAKAVELSEKNKEATSRMCKLRDKLINNVLKKIPDTMLNGHPTQRLCNNANFSIRYVEGESLVLLLDQMGVAASTGSACSQRDLKPSHVLTAIGLKPEIAHGSLRLTLSRYTTEEEVDFAVSAIVTAANKLRRISPLSRASGTKK